MKVMSRVAEIDAHVTADDHGVTPRVVVVLRLQRATCIGNFSDTAEVIACVIIIPRITAADALFALSKETLGDRGSRAVAFLDNRIARPHECFRAQGTTQTDPDL